jgi:sensory rhodopsin
VVWLLAPTGVGILQAEMEAIVVVYLDFISKVGFVAFAVLGADAIDRLVTDDPAATSTPTPDAGDAPVSVDD